MRFIPVLPIKTSPLFPGNALPLRIGRAQSIAAVEWMEEAGGHVLAIAQKSEIAGVNHIRADDLYLVGTLAKVEKVRGNKTDGYQVVLRGISRFLVNEFSEREGVLFAEGSELRDVHHTDASTNAALLDSLKKLSVEMLELLPSDTHQLQELVRGIDDLSYLIHLGAANVELTSAKKQEVLETVNVRDRALLFLNILQKQKQELEVRTEINEKLSHKLGKQQREAILREQMRTIQDELNASDSVDSEESGDSSEKKLDLKEKIEQSFMPKETKKSAREELRRLEAMGNSNPEAHMIRNYLELLVSLPWANEYVDVGLGDLDLGKAEALLHADHYGLQKIKKRVLEHLAVMKLRKSSRGQILLFVGPPGVGKTSLGQSIAKALGRKFVRGSLGGVRDDAEIRGHRRTYIGAMPGRIIQGLKRAGEPNPVFMLDEIDKLGRGYSGDPAAALLEVLDPEQNATFLDHYLDVPFDLSKVFFIATANTLDTIPGPLLDRMEVIDLSGYTTAEKLHIAKNHLIPKEWKEHGILPENLQLSDEALLRVIHAYTREAGVRDLSRKIATLCRGEAQKVLLAKSDELPIRIEVRDLEDLLGPERFVHEVAERLNPPGVATGLAWTPLGGEILFIEANAMPGTGSLLLTGQLGEVMKESTQIALSLVRSRLAHLIPDFQYEKRDIHVHVPAGAIPKDGPSAGITMLTTIASLLTGRSVDSKLAMTGEVTLRGAVMPVGGIKEKVIAAHRAGIERIILSKRNEKDLKEVPDEVKSALRFDFVETASEVLELALGLTTLEKSVLQPSRVHVPGVQNSSPPVS